MSEKQKSKVLDFQLHLTAIRGRDRTLKNHFVDLGTIPDLGEEVEEIPISIWEQIDKARKDFKAIQKIKVQVRPMEIEDRGIYINRSFQIFDKRVKSFELEKWG